MTCSIDTLNHQDWEQVSAIYQEGLLSGKSTFETQLPTWDEWNKNHLPFCRFVIRSDDRVIAWAALSPISQRAAYSGVASISIYIDSHYQGQGLGQMLLQALITDSEQHGIWTLQATAFAENQASIALHKKLGFREIGRRERIAQLDGEWKDTIMMEKRSKIVGI